MKVKLGQLKISEKALLNLSQQPLSITVAFQISQLIKQVAPELQELESQRLRLIEKYGTKNAEDDTITVLSDNIASFAQELSPLLETEIDLNFEKIPLSQINEDVKISSADLIALEPFIDTD